MNREYRILEKHRVPPGINKRVLDRYAYENLETLSTHNSARKAIKRGEILVNGSFAHGSMYVTGGEHIELIANDKNQMHFNLKLKIFYEDNCLAVVEKPPGWEVMSGKYRTIQNALPANLKKSNDRDALPYPIPVHRLDYSTGGLLLTAKTSSARIQLNRQFQDRLVLKRYRAICLGRIEKVGVIRRDIEGRSASTFISPVGYYPSLKSRWITLIDAWPCTGRTHQIRKHLSGEGHPVLGDPVYGKGYSILKSKGLFLWSVELCFKHPVQGWYLNIRTEEPKKFKTFIQREEKRWFKYHSAEGA